MDPNATLATIREIAERARRNADASDGYMSDGPDPLDELNDLAGHIQALDEWLGRGGFLPDAWNRQASFWTFEGEALRDFAAEAAGARRLRISVDWGELKWKRNEDTWSPGKDPDHKKTTEMESGT